MKLEVEVKLVQDLPAYSIGPELMTVTWFGVLANKLTCTDEFSGERVNARHMKSAAAADMITSST